MSDKKDHPVEDRQVLLLHLMEEELEALEQNIIVTGVWEDMQVVVLRIFV